MRILCLLIALLLISCRDATERDSQPNVTPTQLAESNPFAELPELSASSADGIMEVSKGAKDSEWREAAEHVVVATTEIDLVNAKLNPEEEAYYREFYMDYFDNDGARVEEHLRKDAIGSALWCEFSASDKDYFDGIRMKDHLEKWKHYRAKLIEKAAAANLDDESLGECLDVIDKQYRYGNAMLPVGAYAGMHGDRKIWVIVCIWECEDESDDTGMGHIRGWAMIADTQEVVGFFTCG